MSETDTQRWRCGWCGFEHDGAKPTDDCPVCKAPGGEFVPATKRIREEAVGETSLLYKPGGPLPGSDDSNQ